MNNIAGALYRVIKIKNEKWNEMTISELVFFDRLVSYY